MVKTYRNVLSTWKMRYRRLVHIATPGWHLIAPGGGGIMVETHHSTMAAPEGNVIKLSAEQKNNTFQFIV